MNIVICYRSSGKDDVYIELINQAFYSAKKFYYTTIIVGDTENIIADQYIKLPTLKKSGSSLELMEWILQAQKRYIDSDLFTENTILFSPDALFIKDVKNVFNKHFDVAVTKREHPQYPINNGVIFIKPKEREKISKLWNDFYTRCTQYDLDTRKWYGDQKSMHQVLSDENYRNYDLKIQKLDCGIYNASPSFKQNTKQADEEIIKYAYILHFKGKRKETMKLLFNETYNV